MCYTLPKFVSGLINHCLDTILLKFVSGLTNHCLDTPTHKFVSGLINHCLDIPRPAYQSPYFVRELLISQYCRSSFRRSQCQFQDISEIIDLKLLKYVLLLTTIVKSITCKVKILKAATVVIKSKSPGQKFKMKSQMLFIVMVIYVFVHKIYLYL